VRAPRVDAVLAPTQLGLPRITSLTRSDFSVSADRLTTTARQRGDVEGQRLVGDVVDLLGQLGRGEATGTFRAQPFGGQPTTVLPGLLTFQPTPRDAAPSADRVTEALQRARVPFASTGF
jgi:hypothetical protein